MFFSSCKEEPKDLLTEMYNPETVPMINSDSVIMHISDSGIMRYKLVTKTWQFFEQAKDPHWYFPDGFYVEQFDSLFHIEVSVKSDTAWRFTRRNVWRLKGHVFIKNIRNETFSSDELFWDEKDKRIYTNKYIEIDQPGKLMLKGMGLESNQSLTEYKILRPFDSEITVEENTMQ